MFDILVTIILISFLTSNAMILHSDTHKYKCSLFIKVYLPGDPMEEGEELTFDSSAYKMYHQV